MWLAPPLTCRGCVPGREVTLAFQPAHSQCCKPERLGCWARFPGLRGWLGHAAGIPSCQGPQGEMGGAWQLWVGPTYPAGAPALRGWLEAMWYCWLLRAHAYLLPLQPRVELLGGIYGYQGRGQKLISGPSAQQCHMGVPPPNLWPQDLIRLQVVQAEEPRSPVTREQRGSEDTHNQPRHLPPDPCWPWPSA